MPWNSSVPRAITGLLAVLAAAPALEGVPVLDGPKVTESKAAEIIAVGFTGERMSRTGAYPETTGPAAEATSVLEGLAVSPERETAEIRCMIAVLDGSRDITAARGRAYDLLAACGQAIAANKTLGGAVMAAWVSGHTLDQDQTQKGAVVTVLFSVGTDAYTR